MARPQDKKVEVLPFYENPKTDDQILMNHQKKYKDGDGQALNQMYLKLYEVAYKNINNRSTKNKYIAGLTAEERQQKAHDAATYIIEQFIKRPGFVITDSFTGYLYLRVQWELYGKNYQAKRDKMLVMVSDMQTETQSKEKVIYIVTNTKTGTKESYSTIAELYLNPVFKGLRKKRLAECITNGTRWKNYTFDILEVIE